MAIDDLRCWKCGADVPDVEAPMPRAEQCPGCTADLHVCHGCKFFNGSAARGCREPVAEEVRDRTRANFCGWFMPQQGAQVTADTAAAAGAREALESLFDLPAGSSPASPASGDEARAALDALFDTGKTPP